MYIFIYIYIYIYIWKVFICIFIYTYLHEKKDFVDDPILTKEGEFEIYMHVYKCLCIYICMYVFYVYKQLNTCIST
jgi:hypothetical protein